MNIWHRLLVWVAVIGITLTIIFEAVIVHTKMAIYTVEYQTAQIDKETALRRLEAEQLRVEGYKALRR